MSKRDIRALTNEIDSMNPADRLRVAAGLLDQGDDLDLGHMRLAKTIIDITSADLGYVLLVLRQSERQ